jgi:hypothetical protein
VLTEDGKKAVRSINRYPEQTRWSADALAKIKATPWSEREITERTVRFHEPVADSGNIEAAAPKALKKFRINAQDLLTHGYTDGCPQCSHIQRYGQGRAGGVHSDPCRDRVLKAIGDTVLGRQRLDDYEERVNRTMAEQIERSDDTAAQRIAAPHGSQTVSAQVTPPARESLGDYQQRIMDDARNQRDMQTTGTPVPAVRGGMRVTVNDDDDSPPHQTRNQQRLSPPAPPTSASRRMISRPTPGWTSPSTTAHAIPTWDTSGASSHPATTS